MTKIIIAVAVLYCWHPPDYGGTKPHPACALTYEQCARLVLDHGGSCRSQ